MHAVTLQPVTSAGAAVGEPFGFSLRTSEVGRVIWVVIAAGGALLAVMILRRTEADRVRSFRTPLLWFVGPATIIGCVFLFFNLAGDAMLVFPIWGAVGLLIYFLYGYRHSHLGKGIVEVPEAEVSELEPDVPGTR